MITELTGETKVATNQCVCARSTPATDSSGKNSKVRDGNKTDAIVYQNFRVHSTAICCPLILCNAESEACLSCSFDIGHFVWLKSYSKILKCKLELFLTFMN